MEFIKGFLIWWTAVTSGGTTAIEWWNSTVSGTIATIIGLGIGIPIALWINSIVASKQRRQDKIVLLQLLSRTLDVNIKTVKDIQKKIASTYVFYSVDVVVFEAVAGRTHDLLSADLGEQIDLVRYELTHFSRWMEKYFSLMEIADGETLHKQAFNLIKPSIVEQAKILLPLLDHLRHLIQATLPEYFKVDSNTPKN